MLRSGWGENWYVVRVTEDDALLRNLSVTVQLESPPGVNYDLNVHGGGGCDRCVVSSGAGPGERDTVSIRWPDRGRDDDRDIYIEVRFSSGSTTDCGQWELTVVGNTGGVTECN